MPKIRYGLSYWVDRLPLSHRTAYPRQRGRLEIEVAITSGQCRGVVIVESLWPNHAFKGGKGINVLTGADPAGPIGGAAFHDTRVWIKFVG